MVLVQGSAQAAEECQENDPSPHAWLRPDCPLLRFLELQQLVLTLVLYVTFPQRPTHPEGLHQVLSGCQALQALHFCVISILMDNAAVGLATFSFHHLKHERSSLLLMFSKQGYPPLLKIGHLGDLSGSCCLRRRLLLQCLRTVFPPRPSDTFLSRKRSRKRSWRRRRRMRTLSQKLSISKSFCYIALHTLTIQTNPCFLEQKADFLLYFVQTPKFSIQMYSQKENREHPAELLGSQMPNICWTLQ